MRSKQRVPQLTLSDSTTTNIPVNLLLSTDQAAEMLAISPKTVRKLIHTGQLKAKRISSRMFRVTYKSIEDYVNGE